jgi:thiosulfate reductase cytochrome b subunit
MADSVYIPGLAVSHSAALPAPRHSALVRITHWISAISFIGLVVSGIGILLAHPRFYWGETGGVGTPSIFDLPLPFMLGGPSGWGRYLHFESAWLCVLNGMVYVASGLASRHFKKDLLPDGSAHTGLLEDDPHSYGLLQRLTYLTVVFGLLPLMIWTGLAMSPAVTSVFPGLVNVLGGHQCARTIHFFCAVALVLFVLVHITMVWRAGFLSRVGAMITGRVSIDKERS